MLPDPALCLRLELINSKRYKERRTAKKKSNQINISQALQWIPSVSYARLSTMLTAQINQY